MKCIGISFSSVNFIAISLFSSPMKLVKEIKESLLHLVFPHTCEGCGSDVLENDSYLCLHCLTSLPQTDFHLYKDNPLEKLFWGRLPVNCATASYFFTKKSLIQHLMHQFKYRGHKELGRYLGRLMGYALAES